MIAEGNALVVDVRDLPELQASGKIRSCRAAIVVDIIADI